MEGRDPLTRSLTPIGYYGGRESADRGYIEYYVLLDSMQPGRDFTTNCEGSLTAGDELTIEVTGEFNWDDCYASAVDTVQANSLFAGRSADGTVIEVAALRHFRNLQYARGDAQYFHDAENIVRSIRQTADIDFDNNNYAWNADRYVGVGNGTKPAAVEDIQMPDSGFVHSFR